MKQVSYARILKELTPDKLGDLPEINISILRNITVESIEPYLRYYCYIDRITHTYTVHFFLGSLNKKMGAKYNTQGSYY